MKGTARYIQVLLSISCVLTAALLFFVLSLRVGGGGVGDQEEPLYCGGVDYLDFGYYTNEEQVVVEKHQYGRALFQENCIACHSYSSIIVGPALKGVQNRRNREWLLRFIKSPGSMIEAGDSAAVAVYNDFNKMEMLSFEHLTDTDIDSILAYIAAHDAVVAGY